MREMQEGRRGHEWQASGTFRHLFPPAFSSMPTTSVRKRGLGCLPSQVNSRVVSLPKPLWLLHLRSPPGYLASWCLLCFRLLSPSHLQVTCLPFPLILGAQSFPLPQSPPVFPVHWPLMLPACLLLSPAWHLSSPCRRSQCRLEGAGRSQFFTAPDRGLSPQGAPTHLSLTNTGGAVGSAPTPRIPAAGCFPALADSRGASFWDTLAAVGSTHLLFCREGSRHFRPLPAQPPSINHTPQPDWRLHFCLPDVVFPPPPAAS